MQKNNNLLNSVSLKQIIDDYAHFEDETLTSFVVKNGTTEIGERAFSKCKNLRSIIFPETLTTIRASAFSECENLEEIILPSSIRTLQYRAFADCKRLKRVVIPDGIETLEWAVFAGAENLEEIVLPESVKTIEQQLFLNCKRLKKVTISKGITVLPDELFKGCNNLETLNCGNITTIGNRTFEDCYKLPEFIESASTFGKNAFRNCRSLSTVHLNSKVTTLSDGLFDGCTQLSTISTEQDSISIGKKTFRNCKSIKDIPTFVKTLTPLNQYAFENCTGLTEIHLPSNTIPTGCFRGCRNIRIISHDNPLLTIGPFAFSGCENLEEVDLSEDYISTLPAECFSHCKKLKKVSLPNSIHKIGSRTFHQCSSLVDIHLPDTIETIKKEAFSGCSSIRELTIPGNLTSFEDAAFAYMDSLESIQVSPFNKTFLTPDHKILIHLAYQKLVLYANGSKEKSYSLKNYCYTTTEQGDELFTPLPYIGEYAFAGAKNLEELIVCGTREIEATAFFGCDNLKKLHVLSLSFSSCPCFNIKDHGKFYTKEYAKEKVYLPFETVIFEGNLVSIFPSALNHFSNVRKVRFLDQNNFSIASNAFTDCILLKEVFIPKNVTKIAQNAFAKQTMLCFENGLKIQAQDLEQLSHHTEYQVKHKLYTLKSGTFHIEQEDKITTVTKQYIDRVCSHSQEIINNPVLFLDFMNDLLNHDLGIKILFDGILFAHMSLENREILFENLKKDDEFFLTVLKISKLLDEVDESTKSLLQESNFSKFVEYVKLFKKYHIQNPVFFHKLLIANYKLENFEQAINDDLPLFSRTIVDSKILEVNANDTDLSEYQLSCLIFRDNMIASFMKLIKSHGLKDGYLFHKAFIALSNTPLMQQLFQIYDANTKRLLKASCAIKESSSAVQNLKDLLILMQITGALEEDSAIRQKASTFITEKIFAEDLPTGESNEYRVVGDDLHRVFNIPTIREFDQEFADFFLENYQELIKEERQASGFIGRIYTNFKEISKTCTSNKGSQRKLKVTVLKCKNYLSETKFDGVSPENLKLATLIGTWYDKNETWIRAQDIHSKSLKAPRNIFTKVKFDQEGLPIYDYDHAHDLKERISSNFSFEWLPKQDYDNLVLGKYCNCCAHVEGAGEGIMFASMILPNCQNLVIRNGFGEIIAKATIYVNNKEGYAVFNNVESSLNYRGKAEIEKIYHAFLRGTSAFLKTYNENNPEYPITTITIGANRNTILEFLTDEKHPTTDIYQALNYGKYSTNHWSHYNGDWESKQRLVLKR